MWCRFVLSTIARFLRRFSYFWTIVTIFLAHEVREVSRKIWALISTMAPLFSAQLVLFNSTVFVISAIH
jgi:hypothetical protein